MANKKIQATATLFLDTKDAQNDAKKFVNDLKQKLSEVETAADKMTVFKDMVAYIAQVDRALSALRKNNKEAFNSMFDGLDINLKQQLEGLFGVNGAQLGQVDALREKLNTLTLKSSIKEIRTFAKEINTLFTSIGVSAPFDNIDEQFSGRTNTGHIQALATSLANFATVWEDLSARVSQGFGGAGGFGSGVFGGLNKEVQEEIDKLKKQKEELQEVIDSINKKPLQLKLTKKNDTSELKRLLGEYNDVKSKMDSSDYNNLSFEEQNKILAERIRLANLLKQANEHIVIQDKGSMDAYDIASIGAGQSTIADAQTFLENFYKDSKGKAEELRKLYIGLVSDIDSRLRTLQGPSTSHDIEDTVSLYNKLNEKIREYFELKKQLNNIEEGSVEYNNIQDRQRAIQSEILTLKQLSEAQEDSLYGIFDDIDETDVPLKNALTNICNTLEVEIPQATNQAGEQIDTFGKKIVNVSEYVSALSGQLKEMFAATGRSANFEYHIAIDGLDIKARHGSEKSIDLATQTETYLDTLFSDSTLYGHSHRGGTSATNIYDIETVLSSYRDGVSIPVHFVVGKDSITTMDFTGLSKDMANQLMQEISATNSNKNAPVINESINKIVEKFTGNSGALKTWNVEQFDDLAKYIYDVSSAASSALTPIEKFQAVLDNMFGKGKVDATKYESLLSGLDKDNAKNIFNQIASIENLQPIKTTDMLTMGQVNAEIDESIAKYKTLREEASLSYADIRNEVDKVIEHYNAGGSATSGLDFFQKYFPEGEWQNVRNLLTDAYDNLISIEEVTNRIAGEFGVDPDTFAQIPNGAQTSQIVDETNQKLREQEQLWENVKIAIKNGIGEVVGLDNMANALEVIEGEIKEGILTSLEECIARFKEFTNISEEDSLMLVGKRERVIADSYDTYLPGEDEVVSKEEADKLRQLSVQQEQLYQNLRSAIKGTLSDIVDVDDMTYAFDTIEKEIEAGLLTTLDQCIEKFKLLTGLDDKRLTSIKDDQRVADSWDYYQGNRYVSGDETVIDSSEYNQLREDLADEQYRANQYAGDAAVAEDRADQAEARAAEAEARVLEVESDALRYQEATYRLLEEKSALQRENDELREQLSTQTDADHQSQLAQAEVAQLELLQQKLLEVKTAVDAKTQAFEEEYVTVDGVVDAEITSLQSLIAQLQEVVAQINLINDGFNNINTNAPKVELRSAPVEQSVATENIHYVTDPQGRPVNAYRGIEGAYSGLVSNRYHGGTFWTTNIELAKEYAGEIGKVEKSLLSMKNPMEIDGQGAYWNQIEYIGDNSDEASQKLHQLNATIKQTETILEHLKTIQPTEKELKDLSRGFISETKNDREIREYTEALEKAKSERDAIFADTNNPYGKKNTNEIVEIAKSKGYDGVIFKDIIDSATGSVTDLSTVMVTFEQNQIHYIETISSTFESAVTSLKNHFGDLTQHISVSSEEVESSIRKMVELRGKVNAGEISEDEYNAFISQNDIAKDYKNLAKKSRAVPDFITGALDGNEFELKHVIESINGMLDNMCERMQNIAKAFGKEGMPLDQLLVDSTNVAPITESPADEGNVVDEVEQLNKLQTVLTEVKNAVLAKTKAFVDEGDVVGQVVGKEVAALMKLAETVDSIVPKVDSLSTKMASIGPIDIEVYKQANKEEKNAETAQKKNSKFGDIVSRNATAKYNSLMGSANSDQFANSKEVAAIATEYEKAYKAMITMRNELRNSDDAISEADETEFKRLTTECNEYAKALDKLIKSTMKLKGNKANPNDYILGNDFVDDAQGRKQALTDFVKSVYDIDVAAENFKKDWNEVVFAVNNGDGTFTQMTATFTAARNEIVALAGDAKKSQSKFDSFVDGVKNRLQSLSQYFIATVGIYDVWNVVKQGIQYVRDIDSALTELKKVTDETDASYAQFLQDMSKAGSVIGATVSDLTTMASEWARLGYSMQEAGKLAESTAILLNVSEFQDATTASEALISTMQAFQYTADESGHVVDILNEVGNNFAVSSDGLAIALQDSASALMEGGNNLEQAVALVAAANRVVQDPNSVGSALRTISLRLRGTSVEVLEEIGEETDGVVESTSKLQEKIKALSGIDILTNTGEYKDTYTILKEIGNVWEDMSDIDQAALLELMAGKNRANTLSAILSNMTDLEGAYNDALKAEGSALKENEAYLDSIQGRIDLFNNSIQTMWMGFIDSDVIKFVVDLGTSLIKLVDNVGILKIALAGLLTYLNVSSKHELDFASMFGLVDTKNVKNQVSEFTSILSTIKNVKLTVDPDVNVAEILDGMSVAAQNGQQSLIDYTATLGPGTDALKAYAASVHDGNYSLAGFQQFITQHNSGLKATSIAAKAAAVGHQLLNAALSAGISLIASFAINAIVKGLDELIVTNDELIQQSDELQNAYSSQSKTIQENISTLKGLKDEFNQLSSGVDDYGNNISLATNDYERYQSIIESIVGISPSLIEGYDAEGNAIANKNGLLEESVRLMQEEQRLNAQKLTSNDNLETIGGSVQAKLEDYQKENPLPYGSAKSNFMTEFAKAISDDDNYDVFKALSPDDYIWSDYSGAGADSVYAQNFASDFYEAIVTDLRSEESKLESYFTTEQRNNMLNYAHEYEKNVQAYNHDIESITNELNSTLQAVPLSETSYYTLNDEMKGYLTQYIDALDVTADNFLDKKQDIIDLTKIIANNRDVQSALSSAFTLKMGLDKDGESLNYKDYQEEVAKIIQEIDKFDYTDEQKKTIFDFIGLDVESKEFDNKISEAAAHARNLLQDRFDAYVGDLSISDILITTKITEDPNSLTFDELEERIEKIKIASTEDFDITNYTKMISAHSAVITEYQEALQKLGKGSFTMDDFVALVEKYPDLAKGVDISSNAFYGLSRNLNRAIKSNTKSFIKDLKELKNSLESAGKSTDVVDQLIEAVENMPDDALVDITQRYGTLTKAIQDAKTAQDQLIASMEENPNEGYETRGEAMEYMKEAMKRGEIGSESNLWNVAERYGFTYDSAKTINENADALAYYIAVRDTWYKQDDDGNYTYEGTENFIKAVEKVVDESEAAETRLAEILTWDYDETTGALHFDYDNKDLPEIISLLSQTEELIGANEQEWMDLMVQVGQYFGVDWSNYKDAKDHLDEIANSTSDAKTKVEEYGKAMQDYFGKETSIDLTNRPMVSQEEMKAAGWSEFDGEYATLFSGGYSNADDTLAVTVTPILPDGEVLGPGALAEYANQLAEGMDPAELKFKFKGKEYTGEDIFLKKTVGKNASQIDGDYGLKLSEAQAQYDQLRDSLNINATINESGIDGLREISELQDAIKEKSDGTIVINENAFRSALSEAEYTEDQIDILVEKIKTANNEAFNFDSLNLDDVMLNKGIDGLKEVVELQSAIREDAETGLTVVSTDMFASILDGVGYSKEQIDALIKKIQEYDGVVAVSGSADPLGLNALNGQIDPLIASLNTLGIEYEETIGTWGDGLTDIKINVPDLVSTLKANNWTDEAIKAYCDQLSETNIEGFQVKVDPTEVDAAIAKANEIPEEESTKYEVTGDGYATVQGINNEWENIPTEYSTEYTVYETTVKSVEEADANGTAWWNPFSWFANGTAHAQGSWGAQKTETALVGELGPELLVRNGRWTTVGDNGAEFTQVRKGDIIFNHKQTEDLLSKGYVTGRGKLHGGAFASGTAYMTGGGIFGRYEFDGKGGWTEYDVNNKVADSLNNAADSLSNAADDISDASDEFEETFDWIEVRLEEINEDLDLKNAQLENAIGSSNQNAIIDDIINTNKALYNNLIAGANEYYNYSKTLLSKIPSAYRKAAQDGTIAIEKFVGEVDEETLKAIQEYREWVQKGADVTRQAEEVITEIRSLEKQQFDNVAQEYNNEASLHDSKIDQFEAHNSLIETDKGFASEEIYDAIINENEAKIKLLEAQKKDLQSELDGIEVGTQDWYDAVNAIVAVDTEIINLKTDIEDTQDNINELHWGKFEVLMKQFKAVSDDAENLLDILAQYDTVDEFGNWTDKGITSLGLLAQQMEVAEMQAQKYKEEIEYLNKNWQKLGYTHEEYIDKLDELKSGQYDSINAYHNAKDAIIDLNKARVDAIKKGIEKELNAYEELIKKKKEALDADKDAHDWQKSVAEQQKNISDIERQIAALSGDNSISARAKRAQLEAELLEAKAEMDEMYYDRTVEKQKEALDKELESFQETKEDEMEDWEKYLENVELVISDTISMVQENTQTVLETLTTLGQEFGLTITEALTNPWKAGETAIQNYGEKLNMSLAQLASLFGMTVDEFAAKLDLTTEGLVSKLDITVAEMATSLGLTQEQLAAKLGLTTADLSGKMNMTIQQFATSMGYTIPQLANKLGTTTSGLVGNLNMTMTQFAGRLGLTVDQLAGKFGLTTKDLANQLGQTYQQLTNPFGMSMSATVDGLKKLEKEYQKILNDIESQSLATVSRVNHAMDKYTNKANNKTSTSTSTTSKPKTVTLGSRINAGSAKIYSDSYGGGAGTQYYGNDPIYTVIGENNGYWLVRYHKLSSGYTGWFKKSDVKAYAKGTKGIKEDQWALIDELGDELQLIPDGRGRLSYMKKGTGVVPADLTANLMEWGKLDPSTMLDQNRPKIGVSPSIVNNTTEIHIDASVGELLHVEHLDGNNPAEITKIVDKAWDKRMKELNGFVRKYSR